MFDEFDNGIWSGAGIVTPAVQFLVGCGYDPDCYIFTAKITPSPYTTQALIQAKLGGLIKLIEACDDSSPPSGDFNDATVQAVYTGTIQNVVTEINGYLSSVYPIPLVQNNTIAILKVTAVNSAGAVTAFSIVHGGNYLVAPDVAQSPVYLRHIDPNCNEQFFGCNWQQCQKGSGLSLTVVYTDTPFSDENGTVVQAKTINGIPIIVSGGTLYKVYDLLVLIGGQSFVPAKIREAALILICSSFYQRRIAPDEKNIFGKLAEMWRDKLTSIGNDSSEGEQLDGTYKRFYSSGQSWNSRSVLYDANSL